MKIPSKNYIIKTFTIVFIILIFINQGMAKNTVGLIMNDTTQSYNGYTLFAPNTSKTTYLIDNDGKLVHQWESKYVPALSAYLLEDGTLLRSAKVEDPSATTTGGFQKIDWDGNIIWEYYYGTQHHDIEPLPNGNVLLVTNDRKPKNTAIQAGRDTNLITGTNIRSLSIIEVEQTSDSTGNIVWQWDAWEHLIQDFDNTKPNFGVVADHPELIDINYAKDGGQDWLHTNSVAYNEDLDQILVSNRNTNEIWIIDHSATNSNLLYRWGNPIAYDAGTTDDQKLHGQHDAHWVAPGLSAEGNIMIFNNGFSFSERGYSSADEIVPPIDGNKNYELVAGSAYGPTDILWSYVAPVPTDFNSPRYGGTQRLPNENTLICNSDRGEFIEVNSSKEIVWRYISPVTANGILEQGTVTMDSLGNWIPNNQVFRCYKYGEDYPGLAGKTLTSGEPLKINDDLNEVTNFKLYNNYPNPFNPTTNIEFVIPEQEFVKITVFDILGNEVKTLLNQTVEPGQYSITWDSRNDNGRLLGSGIFFYTIQAGQFNQTKKMILLR